MFNGTNLIDREPPIEPTAMLYSTIRKLYSSDEIRRGIAFDERLGKVRGIIFWYHGGKQERLQCRSLALSSSLPKSHEVLRSLTKSSNNSFHIYVEVSGSFVKSHEVSMLEVCCFVSPLSDIKTVANNRSYASSFVEVIKETYFKDKLIEFDLFSHKQGKNTINGQKRAFCGRQKQKDYVFQVLHEEHH